MTFLEVNGSHAAADTTSRFQGPRDMTAKSTPYFEDFSADKHKNIVN